MKSKTMNIHENQKTSHDKKSLKGLVLPSLDFEMGKPWMGSLVDVFSPNN
jgi:hypothetical protein